MAAARVLIVDDDEVARTLINLLLRGHGYNTSFAVDAYAALSVARAEPPDAVVLDFGLPGGDALVVIERLRRVASLAGVPVLVVSARAREPNAQRALDAGAWCFIEKPFDPKTLLNELAQALAGPAAISTERAGAVFRFPVA